MVTIKSVKYLIVIVFLFSALLITQVFSILAKQSYQNNVDKVITPFFTALASKEWGKAQEFCVGTAAANLRLTEDKKDSIDKVPIEITIGNISKFKNLTRVPVCIEINGEVPDIHSYAVDLIKKDNKLRIYRVTEIPLPILDVSPVDVDPQELQDVFVAYLTNLKENKLEQAVNYTAGYARNALVNSKEILSAGPVLNSFEDIELIWAEGTKKQAAAYIKYTVDNRPAEVLVTYYKPKGGEWLINDVASVN